MGEVWDRPQDLLRLSGDLRQPTLDRRHLLPQPPPFRLAGLAFGRVGGLGDRLADEPCLVVEPVDVRLHLASQPVEVGEPPHVG